MSLRIRRGTEAQRPGATFDLGEIVWTTDTNKLYVGDGVNAGGKNILATSAGTGLVWNTTTQRLDFNGSGTGIVNVQADTNPSLGGNLNLNNRNITGTGNINITGTVTATQFVGIRLSADTNPSLSGNLELNNRNITGTGNINITGAINATQYFNLPPQLLVNDLTPRLGGNLTLNNKLITGTGSINITGSISATDFSHIGGFMYIGKNTAPTNLVIIGNQDNDVVVTVKSVLTGTAGLTQQGPIIRTSSSKGTLASPLPLSVGDSLGQINFQGLINAGSNGAVSADIVSIKGVVATAGDLISNIATGRMELIVLNGPDPALAKIATFDSGGVFKAPVFQLTTYANDTARATAIPTPQTGMMVFMISGVTPTVTNKAVIYNGTAWAALPG
jgi:hypothetical protein